MTLEYDNAFMLHPVWSNDTPRYHLSYNEFINGISNRVQSLLEASANIISRIQITWPQSHMMLSDNVTMWPTLVRICPKKAYSLWIWIGLNFTFWKQNRCVFQLHYFSVRNRNDIRINNTRIECSGLSNRPKEEWWRWN